MREETGPPQDLRRRGVGGTVAKGWVRQRKPYRNGRMSMRVKSLALVAATGAVGWSFAASDAATQSEQFVPRLVYRTGPYAPNGIPFADGYVDYIDMINARDGGIGGGQVAFEELGGGI